MSKIPTFTDFLNEDLRNWFGKGKQGGVGGGGWDRYNTKGERIGKCGDADDRGGEGEGKPKCLSTQKANQLRAQGGKQAIANAVKRKKEADPVTDRPGTGNTPKMVSNRIKEENEPTNPSLWSKAKSMARSKFDVYPSAYANGWAAKWYKDHGGGWRTKKNEQVQTSTPADREWGTDSLVAIYKHDTPGETHEAWEKNPNCQQCKHKLSPAELKRGDRVCAACVKQNKGRVWGKDSDDDYEEQMDLVPMRSEPIRESTSVPFHVHGVTSPLSVAIVKDVLDGRTIFRVFSGTEKIGYAKLSSDRTHVTDIDVHPKWQRKGIATALYNFIEKHLGRGLKPSPMYQTPAGKAFWMSRSHHDEQMDLVPMRSVNEGIGRGSWRPLGPATLGQRGRHQAGLPRFAKPKSDPSVCDVCGKPAMYRADKLGFCQQHRANAIKIMSKNLDHKITKFMSKYSEDTSMSLPSFKQFVAEQSHANTLREKFFDGFEGHGHDGWTEVWIDPTTGEVADASRKTLWQVARGKFPIPPDRAYRCRAWVTSKHVFVWDAEADNHMDVEAFVQRSAREQKLSMDFSHAIPLDLYYWPNAKKLGIRVSDWSAGGHVDVMTAVATLQKHPWIKGNSAFKNIIPV